jgi:hypothetical protein
MSEFFKGLKLDSWYMAITYLGGVALLLSFFVEVQGISNNYLQILAGGIFLFGLGEWKNHKDESYMKPSNAYTGPAAIISYKIRRPDAFGVLLEVIGILMIGYGIFLIVTR